MCTKKKKKKKNKKIKKKKKRFDKIIREKHGKNREKTGKSGAKN